MTTQTPSPRSLSETYKALIAFGTSLVTTIGTLQVAVESTHVAPSAWTYGLGVAGSAVAGALTYLKRNEASVGQIEHIVANNQELVKELIEQYRSDNP